VKLIDVLTIKEWNPNAGGGAWFPLVPVVGSIIEVEKYTDTHYRWSTGHGVDCFVPLDCFVELKENTLTTWNKKEV